MERNAELLRAVADRIELEPWLYEQRYFGSTVLDNPTLTAPVHVADGVAAEQPCGTAYCVAGWAVELVDGMKLYETGGGVAERAQELLGLNGDEAGALFYDWMEVVPGWPELDISHRSKAMAEKLRAIADGEPVVAS